MTVSSSSIWVASSCKQWGVGDGEIIASQNPAFSFTNIQLNRCFIIWEHLLETLRHRCSLSNTFGCMRGLISKFLVESGKELHISPFHTYSTARWQLRISSSPEKCNKISIHDIYLESLIDNRQWHPIAHMGSFTKSHSGIMSLCRHLCELWGNYMMSWPTLLNISGFWIGWSHIYDVVMAAVSFSTSWGYGYVAS